ncbi:MAG: hypothetical protein JJE30_08195 [Desulfuromonadales bacterium]|nr:hypothetical protein [Desulfuromonadales bacterium]
MTTRHDIATFIIGIASIATIAILLKINSMLLIFIQLLPYCIIYLNIRAKAKVFGYMIGIICVVSGLAIYYDFYISYIVPPDPQSGIGLFWMPFMQIGLYFLLVAIISGLANFRIK